ncbi:MAG: prepilin-type N-terminal cleavage/methylation domain-containing protein [Polyangiales bacterium]
MTRESISKPVNSILARRRRREAMTLVEIMIVVIIMAMIATAVGVAVVPKLNQARVTQTRTDAQTVASAANSFIMTHPNDCPSMEDLVEAGEISRNSRTKDAWEHDFQIECDSGEAVVKSAGPDGQFGTDDDI